MAQSRETLRSGGLYFVSFAVVGWLDGFSKDGKIKIQFYYRDSDGFIDSFFPKLD